MKLLTLKSPLYSMLSILCLTILVRSPGHGICANPDQSYSVPTSLKIEKVINISVGAASSGVAVNLGAGDKIFIAINFPSKLISFDFDLNIISSQEQFNDDILSISDFCVIGGFTLIVSDQYSPNLYRVDSKLRRLSPIILEEEKQGLQPTSLTSSIDGEIYFANASDNEIWILDRNSTNSRHSKLNGDIWLTGSRIEYLQPLHYNVILSYHKLYFINSYGNISHSISHKHSVVNPSDIAMNNTEVWIGGESIECFSIDRRETIFNLTKDQLLKFGIEKISALAIDSYSILYVLSEHGDKLFKASIVRETTGK